MKKVLIFLLLAATIGSVGYAQSRVADYREAALEADAEAARADTVRLLALAALDSTTTAYELRIAQVELERDEIDRELDAESALRLEAELRMDTLWITDTVQAPIPEDTTEIYDFEGDDGPFHVVGSARLFPSRAAIFAVSVATGPVPVAVRVTCGGERAVRSASVLLTADDPFELVPTSVEQTPDVCNAMPPKVEWLQVTKDKAVWAGVGALIGFAVAHLTDDGFRAATY